MSSVWPFIMSLVLSWYHCQAQPFVSAKIESSSTTKKNPIINSEIVEDLESGLKNVISQRMARFFMDSTSSSGYGQCHQNNARIQCNSNPETSAEKSTNRIWYPNQCRSSRLTIFLCISGQMFG